jgi:hypothetical protein
MVLYYAREMHHSQLGARRVPNVHHLYRVWLALAVVWEEKRREPFLPYFPSSFLFQHGKHPQKSYDNDILARQPPPALGGGAVAQTNTRSGRC